MTALSSVLWGSEQVRWFTHVNAFARATGWLHGPARAYTTDGLVAFALLMLASWWVARRTGDPRLVAASLWAPFGTLVALGLNQFLVHAVDEPRPFTVLPQALVLVHRSADGGFPSDHAVVAGAVTAGVVVVSRRLGALTAVLALLLAATRVYVGAHWPLDVVAGLLVGAALSRLTLLVARPVLERLVRALAGTPLRVLVTAVPAPPAGEREPETAGR